jgi:16S rRNA (cytidine1402-2'-O)-methyltransferase
MNKGKLYLIPNVIADDTQRSVITPQVYNVLPTITHFLVEDLRTARRYLSSLKVFDSIEALNFQVLDKDTKKEELPPLFEPISQGLNIGIISEAGCPGVADPGALGVKFAHENNIRVIPLVGPSSLLLALMASGLNGQQFSFHGYLPTGAKEGLAAIRSLEQESRQKNQTQIFIETPYRNNHLRRMLLANLRNDTLLSIAADVTGEKESIRTLPVREWKREVSDMPKVPAVFMFLAS